ncbi:alpha-glucosidase [Lactiplantibacillus plantarum]|uniref:glycoside hydrolase family 13 protein n=1 Tax=Lactiplantibacillus plantarum TaxID=1590 RepID=UPI0013703120|nr:alpha-glucosidase [Lactiplantibacillus plantarum]MDN7022408.1 alpha-glucosidase [Lactiplantibacillus plantarum]MDN7065367.1 alpha-glucosidase [Lactiplantibacillus plantarum]MDN7070959.1 alpha-glucosidase [Lactiplantibacillus plantarum]MZV33441.1 glucohydrolase [Lactiplantibacillus plantarum]MZV53755.1 glucohydrolase [Lactiplantibacillus plantarum]
MKTNEWWRHAVVYQIYPQSFKDTNNDGIGDLRGVIEKLDYIKSIGVNTLWLTPVFESPLIDNGYDVSDYKKIASDFGTMQDMEKLITEAHRHGLKLIFDLVVNHSSDKHQWFQESKLSRNNAYSDYYIWRDPRPDGTAPSNLGSVFGGSAWTYVKTRNQYYLHLFAQEQPDLNWDSKELRYAVYDIMDFWLAKGVDGFRMDSISFLSKNTNFDDVPVEDNKKLGAYYYGTANGPHIHEYLQEMHQVIYSKYPNIMLVGETPHTSMQQAKLYVEPNRKELNMVFQFEHMHVDYGEYGRYSDVTFKMSDLRQSMARWQEAISWNALYLGNHDQPRLVSRFGNEGRYREKSAKMLAMIQILQKGTPFIYQGDEIGMTNAHFTRLSQYRDLEAHNTAKFLQAKQLSKEQTMNFLARKSRDNARTPMQWQNDVNAGFSAGKPWIDVNTNYDNINVNDAQNDKSSILTFYQRLIALKLQSRLTIDGDFTLINANDSSVFAYQRQLGSQKLIVLGSFSEKKVRYVLPKELMNVQGKLVLSNYQDTSKYLTQTLFLRPYEGVVYLINEQHE